LLAWFDELAQATGATVCYIHHDAKGAPGDRETRDRGSGSGVLGRDYDACMTLTEHRDQEDALVIGVLLRNYPPQAGVTVVWKDGCFSLETGLEAVAATSSSKAEQRRRVPGVLEIAQAVREDMLSAPLRADKLKAQIQSRFNVGRIRADDVCRLLVDMEGVEVARTETFPARVLIGPPGATLAEAARITEKWRNRELEL
jgi:RecA-family ATPase